MTEPAVPVSATGSMEAPLEDVLEQSADLEPEPPAPERDPESSDGDALEQSAPADDASPPAGRAGGPRWPEADPGDLAEQEVVVDLDDADERR